MIFEFEGPIWFWKGPAPHHFVTVPKEEAEDLKAIQSKVTYGWGMIPVTVWINDTKWTTALFPKDGSFIVPMKLAARRAEGVSEGDIVKLRLEVAKNFE